MMAKKETKSAGKGKRNSRMIKCPSCGVPTLYEEANAFRPFCSSRCKGEDIVGWATESYRVAGPQVNPEDLANQSSSEEDEN